MECSRRSTIRRLSAADEALDEALRRGSFGALLSGLLLAIAFPAALWLSDFVPEHAKPAWISIKRDVVFFVKKVAFHPSAASAGSAPDAEPPQEVLGDRALAQRHIDAFIAAYDKTAQPFAWTMKTVPQRRFKNRLFAQLCFQVLI